MPLMKLIAARRSDRSETGAALIAAIMVIALVSGLAATVTTLTINNLQSAQRAQEAGVAVNAADAGIAQAVSYLRANGLRDMCAAPSSYDAASATFNSAFDLGSESCVESAAAATPVAGQPYSVLIVTEVAYPSNDPAIEEGRYRIFSRGVGGQLATRLVSSEVQVGGLGIPKGFFGHSVTGSGTVTANQSIFTTGCVYKRDRITMSGIDGYGLPAAVHSSKIITDDQGVLPHCSKSNKSSHKDDACEPAEPFDHSALGGSLLTADPTCIDKRAEYPGITTATWDKYYPEGSKIADDQTLFDLFDIKDPALTQPQIDRLRQIAKSQDNHRTASSPSDVITPQGREAVLFFDLRGSGGNADLSTIKEFTPPPAGCLARSLVIVIEGGGAIFHSGDPLAASVFVTTPGETYDANGGKLIGTVYADKIKLGGNTVTDSGHKECFFGDPSPHLLDINVTSYREIDS